MARKTKAFGLNYQWIYWRRKDRLLPTPQNYLVRIATFILSGKKIRGNLVGRDMPLDLTTLCLEPLWKTEDSKCPSLKICLAIQNELMIDTEGTIQHVCINSINDRKSSSFPYIIRPQVHFHMQRQVHHFIVCLCFH